MTLAVQPVPAGAVLVDCYAPLTLAQLQRLAGSVYKGNPIAGVGRYLENLTREEIDNVHACGLGLFTIGVAHKDSMDTPSAGLGSRDGLAAVQRLRNLGVLPGVSHGLDVERIDVPLPSEETVAYVNAACACIRIQTECMLYLGWGIQLGAEALYHRLSPSLYWASSPKSLAPAVRGFAMVQLEENIELAGVKVDVDEANPDALGGVVHWQAPQ